MPGWTAGGTWWAPSAPPAPPGAIVDDFDRHVGPGHAAGWGPPSGTTCDLSPIAWTFSAISPDVDHVADATDFDRVSTESVAPTAGHVTALFREYPALSISGIVSGTATFVWQLGAASIPCTKASEALVAATFTMTQAVAFPPVAPDGNNAWSHIVNVSFEGDAGGGTLVRFRRDFDQLGGLVSSIFLQDDDSDPVTIHGDFADTQHVSIDRSTSRGTTIVTTDATGPVVLPLIYFDPGFPEDQPYIFALRDESDYSIRDATEVDPAVHYDATFDTAASGYSAA